MVWKVGKYNSQIEFNGPYRKAFNDLPSIKYYKPSNDHGIETCVDEKHTWS